jgi:hypothetical protein
MAGRPSKKAKEAKAQAEAAAKTYDDFAGDDGGFSEDVPEIQANEGDERRDWRDVEKYREARDLRRLVDEDLEAYLFREEKPRASRSR